MNKFQICWQLNIKKYTHKNDSEISSLACICFDNKSILCNNDRGILKANQDLISIFVQKGICKSELEILENDTKLYIMDNACSTSIGSNIHSNECMDHGLMSLPSSDMEEMESVSDLIIFKDVDVADFSDPYEKHLDGGVNNINNCLAEDCFPSLHQFSYEGFRFFMQSYNEERPNDFSYMLNNEYSQFSCQPREHFTIHDSEHNNDKCCIKREYSLYDEDGRNLSYNKENYEL